MFKTEELLALPPAELAELLAMAEGDLIVDKAHHLGLDVFGRYADYQAVKAAVPTWDGPGDPEGPIIGAGQTGVRSDLTPDELPGAGPTGDGDGDLRDVTDALSPPAPDPVQAEALAAAIDLSKATGRPFMGGTYALYALPDGSVLCVTEDAHGTVERRPIPAMAVRAALALMSGEAPEGFVAKMLRKRLSRG